MMRIASSTSTTPTSTTSSTPTSTSSLYSSSENEPTATTMTMNRNTNTLRPPQSPRIMTSKKFFPAPSTSQQLRPRTSSSDSSASRSSSNKNRTSSGPSHKPDLAPDPALEIFPPYTPTLTTLGTDSDDLSCGPEHTLASLQVGVEVALDDATNTTLNSTTNHNNNNGGLEGFLEETKSSYGYNNNGDTGTTLRSEKTFFWKSKGSRKVSSSDVASVGNASDTAVSVNSNVQVTGRDLHEAAKRCLNAGDFAQALPQFQAILAAQVRRFGVTHPSVGAAMHNVGVCRQRMSHWQPAEEMFAKAVAIRQGTLGPKHAEVAASLSKLGQTQVFLHNFEAAFENLRKALVIARHCHGPTHKTVAQVLCHTACLYFEAGELFAAQASFQDATDIYRALWKTDRKDRDACMSQLTDALCNIGSIQNRRKRFDDAIATFKEALDLQRGVMGHDHPRVVATLDNIAYSYSKTRDYPAALTCYKKMLRAQVSHCGTFSDECFDTFRKQVLMYEKLKLFSEAVDEIKETLRLQKSMLSKNSEIIARTKEMREEITEKLKRSKSSPVAV